VVRPRTVVRCHRPCVPYDTSAVAMVVVIKNTDPIANGWWCGGVCAVVGGWVVPLVPLGEVMVPLVPSSDGW
jgi:hypothetical protein